jgi:hypothetical protein
MRNQEYKAKFVINGYQIEVTATFWAGVSGSYFEPEEAAEFEPVKILIDGVDVTSLDDEAIAEYVEVADYWDFWAEATEVLYSANERKLYPYNS